MAFKPYTGSDEQVSADDVSVSKEITRDLGKSGGFRPYTGSDEQVPIEPYDNSGFIDQVKAVGVRALQAPVRLAEIPFKLFKAGVEKITPEGTMYGPEEVPEIPEEMKEEVKEGRVPYPSEMIGERYGGEEKLAPKGKIAEGLQMTAENWPLALLGGGSIPLKLGADLAGSYGMVGAKALGLGPWWQIGAGVLGASGFSKAAGGIKTAIKDYKSGGATKAAGSKIKDFIKTSYDKEAQLGSKLKVGSQSQADMKKEFFNLEEEVSSALVHENKFNYAAKKRTLENIRLSFKEMFNPEMTASDLFKVKKKINKVYAPPGTIEGNYFARLSKIPTDGLNKIASKKNLINRKWGEAYKMGDELTSIEHWSTKFGAWAESDTGKSISSKIITSPLTGALLGAFGIGKFGMSGAAASIAPVAAKAVAKTAAKKMDVALRAPQFLRALMKTKSGKKVLWDIVASSASLAKTSSKVASNRIGSALNKLNNEAIKFTESGFKS